MEGEQHAKDQWVKPRLVCEVAFSGMDQRRQAASSRILGLSAGQNAKGKSSEFGGVAKVNFSGSAKVTCIRV